MPWVKSIAEVSLDVSELVLRLGTKGGKAIEIQLGKKINPTSVKAKLKKNTGRLVMDAFFKR